MRLDRNEGRQKYGLIKNREVTRIMAEGGGLSDEVQKALNILIAAGVVDLGDKPETEFFVIRLKDKFAASGLYGYANAAYRDDPEYADDVFDLAKRAGPVHPNCKGPD